MVKVTFDINDAGDCAQVLMMINGSADAELQTRAEPEPMDTAPEPMETDIHGMVWDEKIHSKPAKKNADGSWRGKRGHADELAAAIADHKGQTAPAPAEAAPAPAEAAPAPAGMPAPAPAAPAPTTPPEPVTYEQLTARFVPMLNDRRIPDYIPVYEALGVGNDLETNQTSIDRLWHYVTALDAGAGHEDAVARAMANAG